MGIFRQFPYSNFHEMNMDELIKIVRQLADEWQANTNRWDTLYNDTRDALTDFQNYVNTYFDNLDLTEAVRNNVNSIIWSQGFLDHITPALSSQTTAWLNAHITQPTNVVVDSSLTVAGAAADAKVTGDKIGYNNDMLRAIGGDLNYSILNGITWEQGSIDDFTGNNLASTTRIRTVEYVDLQSFKLLNASVSNGYKFSVAYFDANKQILPTFAVDWTTNRITLTIPDNARYARFVVATIANATIEPAAHINFYTSGTFKVTTEMDGIINDTLIAYTADSIPIESISSALTSTDWYWISDYRYPKGYINSVRVKGTANSNGNTAYVAFIDPDTGKLLYRSVGLRVGSSLEVTIPCNIYIDKPYYIGVCLPYLAHTSNGTTVHWAKIWQPAVWDAGAIIPITWESSTGTYKWAVQVNYQTYSNFHNMVHKKHTHKVFIAGDSITAGYPYTTGTSSPYYAAPDIRYGSVFERLTGNPVTFASSSGSGWLYRTASDAAYAISIADNTNFSDYDVAVFAFGTNDYGNNMAIGSVNDVYPSRETVCGAINYILNRIRTTGGSCTPIIILPIVRTDHGDVSTRFAYGSNNNAGYSLGALCDRIIDICKAKDVPYIDPRCSCPLNARTASALLLDDLHPSITGYKILSPYLANKIAEITSTYPLSVLQQNH